MIDFELPEELIAQEPARPRESARLLVYERSSGKITDSVFSKVGDFLPSDTALVLNNSKVENCRWLFDEGRTEIFVLEKLDQHSLRAMVRPGKKFRLGDQVKLNDWLQLEVTAIDDDGLRTLKLNVPHDDERLKDFEHVPLPPYIQQNDDLAAEYQTVYAKPLGSKAAPTAGLHFSSDMIAKIKESHDVVEVTLHVGLGTFAQLNEINYSSGKLHEEWYHIGNGAADKMKSAHHITAVGTTTTRTLESWKATGKLTASTDIFIQPGYKFKAVDSLLTNFHLPGTSLLLMIEAFVGSKAETQRIYDHAIAEKYRFYSFGDAMLIV